MLDRTAVPAIHAISAFRFKQAHTHELKNGIPVHTIKAGKHDILRIELLFRSGRWYETTNGISYFTSKMLLEGTNHLNSEEIAAFFESKGANVHVSSGMDLVNISIYVLKANFSQILDVIKECITEPTFPDQELETLKSIQIQHIRVNNQKNDFLAAKQFRRLLYGKDHPYGRDLETGDIGKRISRASIVKFFRDHFNRGMVIILSGDVDDEHLKSIEVFSDLGFFAADTVEHIPDSSSAGEVILKKTGSLQSSIRYGRRLPGKNHPDYFRLILLNEILGGFFGSRLMRNIREDKGYTYGVHSRIINHIEDSYWVIGTDVKKEYTGQTMKEIGYEFKKLSNILAEEKELILVKNYLRGSFLSSLETSFSLADKFKSIYFHGLDYSFYDRFFSDLESISAGDILETSRKYLDPDEFYLSIAGEKP